MEPRNLDQELTPQKRYVMCCFIMQAVKATSKLSSLSPSAIIFLSRFEIRSIPNEQFLPPPCWNEKNIGSDRLNWKFSKQNLDRCSSKVGFCDKKSLNKLPQTEVKWQCSKWNRWYYPLVQRGIPHAISSTYLSYVVLVKELYPDRMSLSLL